MDHVTYALLIFSGTICFYLYVHLLMALWENSGRNAPDRGTPLPTFASLRSLRHRNKNGNGYAAIPAHLQNSGHISLQSPTTPRTGESRRTESQTDDEEEALELTDAYWDDDLPNGQHGRGRR